MDFETVSPEDFGASLKGFGLNLLVTDVKWTAAFLETVFGMAAKRLSADFAILTHGEHVLQLHADSTYHSNPLLGLLPENPPRGAGLEIRLYDVTPNTLRPNASPLAEPCCKRPQTSPTACARPTSSAPMVTPGFPRGHFEECRKRD